MSHLDLIQTLRQQELRSTCQRRHVACLFVDRFDNIVAQGFNNNTPFLTCERPNEQGNCGCLHAEVRTMCDYDWKVPVHAVYVSAAPCANCAKVISLVMPDTVFYLEDSHPMVEGFKVLDAAGICHAKITAD